MALFCCRYLSSQPFLVVEECPDTYGVMQSGYFSFMDYAAVYFTSHCQAIQSPDERLHSPSKSEIAVDAAFRGLVRSYSSEGKNALVESPCTDYTLEASSQGLSLSIQQRVALIRVIMRSRQSDLPAQEQFITLEGPRRLKCPRIECSKFAIGFLEHDVYEKHLDAHERPFMCTYADCFAYVTGYASQQQLRNHFKHHHKEISQHQFLFPVVDNTGKWDIIEACKAGNLDEVKRFHLAGVDISKTVPNKGMPLSAAVRAGHFQICEYLVNNRVDPYKRPISAPRASSPIHQAIRHGQSQIMELFVRRNCDMDYLPELIALAISAKFCRGLDLLTAFIRPEEHLVVITEVLVSLLVSESSHFYSCGATEIHAWFERIFPKLYYDNDDLTDSYSTRMRRDSGEYQTIKEAIRNNEELLRETFRGGCHPLQDFLLDFVNKDELQVRDDLGNTPLHHLLVGARQEETRNGKRCHIRVAVVQRILRIDDGLSANIPNNNWRLPAHTAIDVYILPGVLETLLQFTKDLNRKDKNGLGLLHHAKGLPGHLQILLEHDSLDLFIRNYQGQTVLSYTVELGGSFVVNVLECLLQADRRLAWAADEHKYGLTPLHHAMAKLGLALRGTSERFMRLDILELLLQLPEVEDILRAYMDSPSSKRRRDVRQFAQEQDLFQALEVMNRIGF
ncbi:hypothetical protein ACHAP5_008321 [Fusarium lateritium]